MHNRIREIEKNVGKFSSYKFNSSNPLLTDGPNIKPQQRLAFQILRPLGCKEIVNTEITTTHSGEPLQINSDSGVHIHSLTGKFEVFTIYHDRFNEFIQSAKVFINTDLLHKEDYFACLGKKEEVRNEYQAHRRYQPNISNINNLAPAICHAQKIDLLVTQLIDRNGEAIADGKSGRSNANNNAIVLLSAPALDFRRQDLINFKDDSPEAVMIIKGMYRNLFRAALHKDYNCQCMALPAGGLGEFLGNPDVYFNCLKEVANEPEFQNLYIIYNPRDKNIKKFDECFANNVAPNVIRTDKDILFFADELIKQGITCAVHNPSDKGAVFGELDIGKNWKLTNPGAYAAEEHMIAISTAFINSYPLSPFAFENPISNSFSIQPSPAYNLMYQQQFQQQSQYQPLQFQQPYQQPQYQPPYLQQPPYQLYYQQLQQEQYEREQYQRQLQLQQQLEQREREQRQKYLEDNYRLYLKEQEQKKQQQNQPQNSQGANQARFFPPQPKWSDLFKYPNKIDGFSLSLAEKIKNLLNLNYSPFVEKIETGFYLGFKERSHYDLVINMLKEFNLSDLQFVSFQQAQNSHISSAKTSFLKDIFGSNSNNDKYDCGLFIPHNVTNKSQMGLVLATAFIPLAKINEDSLKLWQSRYERIKVLDSNNSSIATTFKKMFSFP